MSSIYNTNANTANTEATPRAAFAPNVATPLLLLSGEEGVAAPLEFVGVLEFVPFSCIASCWNAEKLWVELALALTAKTMPAPQ